MIENNVLNCVVLCSLHPSFLPFLTLFSPNSKRPPCLPYLGAYLDQVWSLEMSKSTKNSQGLINFGKMQSVSNQSTQHY